MKKEQIHGALILLSILSGCTAIQEGPKFIWSSNLLKKADSVNWICVGTMRVGELINPVTWFWTPPVSHVFVKQDKAQLQPDSDSEWVVVQNTIDYNEGQTVAFILYDTVSNKTAYIASDDTSETDFQMNMRNPDWKNPETEWSRNTLRWLKDGKPLNASFCT